MKKRIIVKDEDFTKFLIENKDTDNITASLKLIMERSEVEQVPETFDELKELCKEIRNVGDIICAQNTIYIKNFKFEREGNVDCKRTRIYIENGITEEITNENITIAQDRIPAQMWQIIKTLVSKEEKK